MNSKLREKVRYENYHLNSNYSRLKLSILGEFAIPESIRAPYTFYHSLLRKYSNKNELSTSRNFGQS